MGASTRHARVDGLEVIDCPEVFKQLGRDRSTEPEDSSLAVD